MQVRIARCCAAAVVFACLLASSPAGADQEEQWENELRAGLAAAANARLDEAKRRFERAVRLGEGMADADRTATSLVNLADIHRIRGDYPAAEALTRRAIALIEQMPGLIDAEIATALNNLASLLDLQGRYAEAEPVYLRALKIREKNAAQHASDVAILLNNIGALYQASGRFAEAESYYRRAFELMARAGVASEVALTTFSNLGVLHEKLGRYEDAEAAFRGALESAGLLEPTRPEVATALHNLGTVLARDATRLDAAEKLLRRSLEIRSQILTERHPDVAVTMHALAGIEASRQRPRAALELAAAASKILRARLAAQQQTDRRQALVEQQAWRPLFLSHMAFLDQARSSNPERRAELVADAFSIMQLAKASDTSYVVAAVAARFASGTGELAGAVRAREDALLRHRLLDAERIRVATAPREARSSARERALRDEIARLEKQLAQLEADIDRKFPDYRALTSAEPVSESATRGMLREREAVLSFLFGASSGYLVVVTRGAAELFPLEVGREELAKLVRRLRRDLDPEALRGAAPSFDAEAAAALYAKLLRPAEHILAGHDHLIVVADAALESLPLGVLLTESPAADTASTRDFGRYRWLARRHAFSYVPSIASLRALRRSSQARAGDLKFAAFADPVLAGSPDVARTAPPRLLRSGHIADADEVRKLSPLPETADEVNAIARSLGADAGNIFLRTDATEQRAKSMDLSRFHTIMFATHGLMAGDFGTLAEPALVLTPPVKATALDDGLLTAGEIAQLKLNAEWVILSACNTAAADGTPGAEGLSGLAKSFFYAGTRALLVSHWAVVSETTVKLTTGMFDELASSPEMAKAEALRRSMLKMIDDPANRAYAHPLYWAPLVIVGEGGAR